MPKCSRCAENGLRCRVLAGHSRCGECAKVGGRIKCDVRGPSLSQLKKLEQDEKKMNKEWQETQTQLLELQARLLRLDKMRSAFRERAGEMLRRGLESLEELDAVEEEERRRAEVPPFVPTSEAVVEDLLLDPDADSILSSALTRFDPDDPFWLSLFPASSGGIPSKGPDIPSVS